MTVALTTAGLPPCGKAEGPYDVAGAGAGVVGAAIAREPARYDLRAALPDAADCT